MLCLLSDYLTHCLFIEQQKNKTQKKREEAIDWWTRLHVTIRGNGNAVPNGDATSCGKDGGGPAVNKLEVKRSDIRGTTWCRYVLYKV